MQIFILNSIKEQIYKYSIDFYLKSITALQKNFRLVNGILRVSLPRSGDIKKNIYIFFLQPEKKVQNIQSTKMLSSQYLLTKIFCIYRFKIQPLLICKNKKKIDRKSV